jgi:VIT1/CCC1 family predicted Fe2+/Mn2+ transporter
LASNPLRLPPSTSPDTPPSARLVIAIVPRAILIPCEVGVSVLCLAGLGALGAKAGGAPIVRSIARVCLWGLLAMGLTAVIGKIFGTAV